MLDAEKSVIGALCLDPICASEVMTLTPQDFTGVHREIFMAAVDLADRDVTPDIVTLSAELKGKVDPLYLSELVEYMPTAANVGHYVKLVRESSQKRQLRAVAEAITRNEGMSTAELLEKIEAAVDAIRGKEVSGPVPLSKAMSEALKAMGRAEKNRGKINGLTTGNGRLDYMISGLEPNRLYIIAGKAGSGKTALAMDIVRNAPTNILIFSLEMGREELGQRALCSDGRVDSSLARIGTLGAVDCAKLRNAAERLHGRKIWVDDTPSTTIGMLRAKAKNHQKRHGLGLVVVDYLQLLDGKGSEYERVTDASRQLKLLSKELHCPVVALSQINRAYASRGKEDKRPNTSDLRASGALEQDADTIIFCYREAQDCECKGAPGCDKGHHRTAELIVAKQRSGPTGTVHCEFYGEYTTFREVQK